MSDPAGKTDEQIVNKIRKLIKPGEDAQKERHIYYDTAYKIWRPQPTEADKRVPGWRSRTRIRYAQANLDVALANIVSGMPRCLVHPRRKQDIQAAKALQHLFDHYISEDHLVEKQPLFAQQGLLYGATVAKNTWGYADGEKMARTYEPHPQTGELQPVIRKQPVVYRDGPCFEPWDIYQAVWDPNARDVDSAEYIVLQSYVTKDWLLAREFNPQTGTGTYRNLDELFKTGPPRQPKTTAQETLLGGAASKRKNRILLEEVWFDDMVIVLGNESVLLRAGPNPHWHGRKPIVIAQPRPDGFEMQGISETELVADIQDSIHTLTNMILDSLKLTVLRGVTYREGSVVDPAMLNLRPNFKWGVTDHDDIRAFEVPQLGSDVYQMIGRLMGDMERVTGISAYSSGADSSTIDQTTATGVTALQSAANTGLRFKASQLHWKGFQRSFEMWGDDIQQFLSTPVELEIAGDNGQSEWTTVSPHEVEGHFRFRLEGSEESLSRQQARSEALNLLQVMTPYAQNGLVNIGPLLEKVALAFDILNPESIINPPQQLPPAAPNNGQQQALPPGGQPPLMNGQQLSPLIQQAIHG